MKATVCVAFNNIDDSSSIGKLCVWSVKTALEAGYRVTAVARDVAPELRQDIEWLPLYVPPRLHAVQWFAAEATTRRAMRGRTWDVVHVQQPQLAGVANMLHLHYLVRSAREKAPDVPGTIRSRIHAAQTRLTESGEGWYLSRLHRDLLLVPVSQYLLNEVTRLYGPHERSAVLPSPAPPAQLPTSEERRAARRALVGGRPGRVVGFLGGGDPRKGGAALVSAVEQAPEETVLLLGGYGLPDHPAVNSARVVQMGPVADLKQFFAACDLFAAVSGFDPGPMTALEAAAFGVPVIGTSDCGFVLDLVARRAAILWSPGQPIPMNIPAPGLVQRALGLVEERSEARQGAQLLALYNDARTRSSSPS